MDFDWYREWMSNLGVLTLIITQVCCITAKIAWFLAVYGLSDIMCENVTRDCLSFWLVLFIQECPY